MNQQIIYKRSNISSVPLLFDGLPWESHEQYYLFLEVDRICYGYIVKQHDIEYIHPIEYFYLANMTQTYINFRFEPFHTINDVSQRRRYQQAPKLAYFNQMTYLGVMFAFSDYIYRFKVKEVRKSYPILKEYFKKRHLSITSNVDVDVELNDSDEQLYEKYITKRMMVK